MSALPDKYPLILSKLKVAIRQSRLKALLSANAEMLLLYWKIGKTILDQQDQSGWGSKVIEQLAKDIKSELVDMHGLSVRTLNTSANSLRPIRILNLCKRQLHKLSGTITLRC